MLSDECWPFLLSLIHHFLTFLSVKILHQLKRQTLSCGKNEIDRSWFLQVESNSNTWKGELEALTKGSKIIPLIAHCKRGLRAAKAVTKLKNEGYRALNGGGYMTQYQNFDLEGVCKACSNRSSYAPFDVASMYRKANPSFKDNLHDDDLDQRLSVWKNSAVLLPWVILCFGLLARRKINLRHVFRKTDPERSRAALRSNVWCCLFFISLRATWCKYACINIVCSWMCCVCVLECVKHSVLEMVHAGLRPNVRCCLCSFLCVLLEVNVHILILCVQTFGPGKVARSPEIECVMLIIFHFFAYYLK